jgi:2-hydroxychromene-2-carboxylate isomerase
VKRRPRLFFSFRSPFSWLLVERLQRELPDAHGAIKFVPFWEPDERTAAALAERGAEIHYQQMSRAKHLYILQDTKRIATRLGLQMAWPVDVAPWWEPSHLGWLKARRLGLAEPFYRAVTEARWRRGEDISDPGVVRRLAASIGADGDTIASAADDPEIRAEGVDSLVAAYEDDVFGVPYFRLGWQRFWGFDRLDDFLTAYRDGAAAARPEPLAGVPAALHDLVGSYDTDTAGGCG